MVTDDGKPDFTISASNTLQNWFNENTDEFIVILIVGIIIGIFLGFFFSWLFRKINNSNNEEE